MKERIVILGGGESGTGAAMLAGVKGYDTFLSDNGLIKRSQKEILNTYNIPFEEGGHTTELITNASLVVKSPGIPESANIVQKLQEMGIPVISEIEFALRFTKAKTIGITGTNGKTTTTLLTHHLLEQAGLNVGLTGNVGISLAKQVATEDKEFYVIELSSFQLDGMFQSKLDVGILLNITPDHLNRYDNDIEKYADSKVRIATNMGKEDSLIFNYSDPVVQRKTGDLKTKANLLPISLEKDENASAYLSEKVLVFTQGDEVKQIETKILPLQGKHNMLNIMASVLAASKAGLSWDAILSGLKTFRNAPHRLEYVDEINGVEFYNDSKATNVDAVWYALESFKKPVILIAGGTDKGNDYSQIDDLVKEKVKGLVALGLDTKKLEMHFKSILGPISTTDSMFSAVEMCFRLASNGDVVLLSPACASFDLFKNYEERGDKFKEAVAALKDKIVGTQTTTK